MKKKAAKIASLSRGSGGGTPISGLSAVERELLDAIGEPVVNGHDDEDVPLERLRPHPNSGNQISRSRDLLPVVMAKPSEKSGPSAQQEAEEPLRKRKRRDEGIVHSLSFYQSVFSSNDAIHAHVLLNTNSTRID